MACVFRANGASEAGRHAYMLAGGTAISRRSSLIRQCWLDCIRRLVTTCSAELLQAIQPPGLDSGHHEIVRRDVETCSGATMRSLGRPVVSMEILHTGNISAAKFNITSVFSPASRRMREFHPRPSSPSISTCSFPSAAAN